MICVSENIPLSFEKDLFPVSKCRCIAHLTVVIFSSDIDLSNLQKFASVNCQQFLIKSRVFLLRQLWIVNYSVKSSSNNLSNENINTGVSVVFKTKRELKCQNELFLKYLETPVFMFSLLRLLDQLLT